VARELASHLRLKLAVRCCAEACLIGGEGTGFSSEIETQCLMQQYARFWAVARELASHLRLKLGIPKGEGPLQSEVARELASHLRLKLKQRMEYPYRSGRWRGNWLLI